MNRTSVGTLMILLLLPWMSGSAVGQPKKESQPSDIAAAQVHAIAWSVNPAERIAAVDDRILREGMTHRGATIVEIRPGSVVFDFAGRLLEKEIRGDEKNAPPDAVSESPPMPAGAPVSSSLPTARAEENEPGPPKSGPPAEKSSFPWTGRTVAELSNIRAAPEAGSQITMRVSARTPLTITGRRGSWLQLQLRDGRTGWIHHSLVEKSTAP